MKVTSFFFTLGLGVLALAHGGHETRSNVRDLSAQSSWDSTIGKGAPALVELYAPRDHTPRNQNSCDFLQLCPLVVRRLMAHECSVK